MEFSILKLKNKQGLLKDQDKFKIPLFWLDSELGDKPDIVKKKWLDGRKDGFLDNDLKQFRKAILTGEFSGLVSDPSLVEFYLDTVLECMHEQWGTTFEEQKYQNNRS